MKRCLVCALLVTLGLSLAPAWGAKAASAGRLGIGGSFALGSPVLDVFYEIPMGDNAAARFAAGVWGFAPGAMEFSIDASFLVTPVIDGFHPYFGGGIGALVLAVGGIGGVVQINLTVNGMGGVYFALSDTFGLYAQIRLLGVIDLADMGITGLLMPGVGLYVRF
ncbi:TPA: hypothetical protein DCY67_03110 [Candidatus Acetothermia bacterium]|nr:hypothetical protein [Candidatus Acetothermia bacterium]